MITTITNLEPLTRHHPAMKEYPQLIAVEPPIGSQAIRAWQCKIQPFASDENVREIICDLHFNGTPYVCSGNLLHNPDCKSEHPLLGFEDRLVQMHRVFILLILEFSGTRHPQIYCIEPEISRCLFPLHPHLRDDLGIWLKRFLPALCIYFAPDEVYSTQEDRLTQLLDFTATWLAKHLVWMRTLDLFDLITGALICRQPLRVPEMDIFGPVWPAGQNPNLLSFCMNKPPKPRSSAMMGTWIGSTAPHELIPMLSQIKPTSECRCGSGRAYIECHRPSDIRAAGQIGWKFA